MDPGIPVPPPYYGGHERLVYMFAEEYTRLGHEVSLLSGPQSSISGANYEFGKNDLNRSKSQRHKEVLSAWLFLYNKGSKFDLIHNFGRLLYLLPVVNKPVKKIMTYGREISGKGIKAIVSLPNKNLFFTACSNSCVSTGNIAGKWATIYNAIDFSKYVINENVKEDAPLIFLGRLEKIKGVHTAIKVAKETGNILWIAGNISETEEGRNYFKNQVKPHIDDRQIIYLGPLNDEQKNEYLGKAKALLFPIEWEEPFGMVMVEAMACGTPVIGYNKGSVPEVIDGDITGFIVENIDGMKKALDLIPHIERKKCRKHAMERFDVSGIAKQYLNLIDYD